MLSKNDCTVRRRERQHLRLFLRRCAGAGQHRLEEAQARDRVKERKARTRRLIQEGAILEKVLPEVRTIELSVLEDYLIQKLPQHD